MGFQQWFLWIFKIAGELEDVQRFASACLEFIPIDSQPTCFGSTPRPIDHCLVSAVLRPAVADAVVTGAARRSHAALAVGLLQRPRSLQWLQPKAFAS